MCGLMSDLVNCKCKKKNGQIPGVKFDTERPYWDQMSLKNTNQTNLVFSYHLSKENTLKGSLLLLKYRWGQNI